MDNLCHTLAGLAMGEAGLKKKAPLGNLTLMIGANLPDVDGAAMFWSRTAALGFRRGWTHGVLAMAVWPLVLAGLMLAVDRLRRRPPDAPRATFGWLLLLASLSIWSHPLLDLMNVYGVRLLMPFSDRWFYADTLFIVDPWIWLALAAGIVLSRRSQRRDAASPFRPARLALAGVSAYVMAMGLLGFFGRLIVRRQARHEGVAISRIMVAPVPLDPRPRDVVFGIPDGYGTARLVGLTLYWNNAPPQPSRAREDFARRAAQTATGRAYLRWARFPVFVPGGEAGCPAQHTCIRDLRYGQQSWAEVAIPDAGPLSSRPHPEQRSSHDQ